MQLGIPRGFFYYDYHSFISKLFQNSDINVNSGRENDDEILKRGSKLTVDEACLPIKLFVGQIDSLCDENDKVLIPRLMKDVRGRWLCPKLLGTPELSLGISACEKLIITDPLYFNNEGRTRRSLWHTCKKLGIKRSTFEENFSQAYGIQQEISQGARKLNIEAAWEFTPETPAPGEIILPNMNKVLLAGHCYNVYDKFANGDIMRKLDMLGIGTVTEKDVPQDVRERAVESVGLIKEPFWESFIRIFGTAMYLSNSVDGIVYLSSFSCGPDAFIVEMLSTYIKDLPIMVIKLDEHRGEAGFETRLEAFADLLERRKASW